MRKAKAQRLWKDAEKKSKASNSQQKQSSIVDLFRLKSPFSGSSSSSFSIPQPSAPATPAPSSPSKRKRSPSPTRAECAKADARTENQLLELLYKVYNKMAHPLPVEQCNVVSTLWPMGAHSFFHLDRGSPPEVDEEEEDTFLCQVCGKRDTSECSTCDLYLCRGCMDEHTCDIDVPE